MSKFAPVLHRLEIECCQMSSSWFRLIAMSTTLQRGTNIPKTDKILKVDVRYIILSATPSNSLKPKLAQLFRLIFFEPARKNHRAGKTKLPGNLFLIFAICRKFAIFLLPA